MPIHYILESQISDAPVYIEPIRVETKRPLQRKSISRTRKEFLRCANINEPKHM